MRLGEFGAAQKELEGEKDDFAFFGETFTVEAAIPPMLMLQLAAAATGKIDESEGLAAMWEALRCSLTAPSHKKVNQETGVPEEVPEDPAQFNRLYKLSVEKRCDLDPLMRLVFALFEAQGGRPTRQVSASSPGQSPTSQSSSVSSTPAAPAALQVAPHPALAHLRPVDDLVRTG